MKNKILKHLYNYLFEDRGQIPKLNIISNKITNLLYDSLNKDLENFHQNVTVNDETLMIGEIQFFFTKSGVNTGNVTLNKNTSFNNLNYFTINIEYNDTITFDELNSIISHELHHYYDMMVRVNTKIPKSKKHHSLLQYLNIEFPDNKIIKEFKHCFYLSFDYEINARIHELSTLLNNSKLKGDELEQLFKSSKPYLDTIKLLNYDSNSLNNLSETDKKKLLNLFNEFGFDRKFNNINQFVSFFSQKFHNKGFKQLRKLSKVYGDKVNVSESIVFIENYKYTRVPLGKMMRL